MSSPVVVPEPVSAGQIEAFVATLAAQSGCVPVEVRWVVGTNGRAHRRRGRPVVELGGGLLCNVEAARFIAAHEMGHVALGHTSRRARLRIWLLIVATLATLLSVGAGAGVWLIGWPGGLGWACLGGAAWYALLPLILRRSSWPAERAADVYAGVHGAPLTAELAVWLARHGKGDGGGWVSTHPSWAHRAAHCQELKEQVAWELAQQQADEAARRRFCAS